MYYTLLNYNFSFYIHPLTNIWFKSSASTSISARFWLRKFYDIVDDDPVFFLGFAGVELFGDVDGLCMGAAVGGQEVEGYGKAVLRIRQSAEGVEGGVHDGF